MNPVLSVSATVASVRLAPATVPGVPPLPGLSVVLVDREHAVSAIPTIRTAVIQYLADLAATDMWKLSSNRQDDDIVLWKPGGCMIRGRDFWTSWCRVATLHRQ